MACGATPRSTPRRVAPGTVFAAGDWPAGTSRGRMVRLEHWTNAAEQGAFAARNLLRCARAEDAGPYVPVPFFWSDQYDRRIQFLGHPGPDDEVRVVAGDLGEGTFVALYHDADQLTGALGVSMPRRGDAGPQAPRRRRHLPRRPRHVHSLNRPLESGYRSGPPEGPDRYPDSLRMRSPRRIRRSRNPWCSAPDQERHTASTGNKAER